MHALIIYKNVVCEYVCMFAHVLVGFSMCASTCLYGHATLNLIEYYYIRYEIFIWYETIPINIIFDFVITALWE